MNLLDENFPDEQRRLLLAKRIHVQKVGREAGQKGMKDDGIIPFLHLFVRPTFFTLDRDFYNRRFCHRGYCLVYLDVDDNLAAEYVRRVLRHRALNTKAKRMGCVIRVQPSGLAIWRAHEEKEDRLDWS